MESKINIFIACHKPTYVIKNPLFVPVQVGTALTQWRGEGMRYDNDGDNISEKNPWYCELTAQYWAWKNCDCDYFGFFHYRRYLTFSEVYSITADGKLQGKKKACPYIELDDIREDLTSYRLEPEWMKMQIEKYDLMTVMREKINSTVYHQYEQYHLVRDLDLILEILAQKYPEYEKASEKYMASKEIYYMNMFIMKKTLFHEYMEWLFDILAEFEVRKKQEDQSGMEPRLIGFLAERLFGVFYTYQREKGKRCAELPYLKFYNTDIGEMKFGQQYIRTFRLKPTKHEIQIDMRKLNRWFPAGSRRRILLRSIFLK